MKYYRSRNTLASVSPKQAIRKAFTVFEKDIETVIKEVNIPYGRAHGKEVKAQQEIISWVSRIETRAALLRGKIEVATAHL